MRATVGKIVPSEKIYSDYKILMEQKPVAPIGMVSAVQW
jgi:hypothetical protein